MTDDQKKVGSLHLTDDAFQDELVKAGDKPVFIDFYADWCGPCQMAAPIVEKLAAEYADKVVIAKLNVDENPQTAQQFGVMSIPTVIIMKKQGDKMDEFDRKIGFPGEDGYRKMLAEALAE
jgi:thioredoxin 1